MLFSILRGKDKRMALHNQLGRTGEQLAEKYLTDLGYSILFRNWRHWRYEIDLVAIKNDILHFIEVKTRTSGKFGLPEESVDRRKLRSLINAAEQFMQLHPQYKRLQFDVLSINMVGDKVEYFLIEDVYL